MLLGIIGSVASIVAVGYALVLRLRLQALRRAYGAVLDEKESAFVERLTLEHRLQVQIESAEAISEYLRARLRELGVRTGRAGQVAFREAMQRSMAQWLASKGHYRHVDVKWIEEQSTMPVDLPSVDPGGVPLIDVSDMAATTTQQGLWTSDIARLVAYSRVLGCHVRMSSRLPGELNIELVRVTCDEA